MMKQEKTSKNCKLVLPLLSILFAVLLQYTIPNSAKQPVAAHTYFGMALGVGGIVYLVLLLLSVKKPELRKKMLYKANFVAGAVLFLNLLNVVTLKFALLPVLYFPSLDRILEAMVNERMLILKCLAYSARLLSGGYFFGALAGVATGILIGFSKQANYWIMPVIRVLGPIPSTAWIPLVLVCFPSAVSASTFLIALSVWFPTTIMTSSGISNVPNAYFEVSGTLGAGKWTQIFSVGVPAAMPYMFLGLFNGTCASFITLITAEMIGAKYGIGWYVNWQKEMLAYANVYAGLIVIAVVFSILITLLFRVRDKVLVWQKGVIKW